MPLKDKEKARAYGLKWRAANREKYREYFKKPEYKLYMKNYREQNREQILEYYRTYAKDRKEKDEARKVVMADFKANYHKLKPGNRLGNVFK